VAARECIVVTSTMSIADDLSQLAPTAQLRGAVVIAPAASTFFAVKDGEGTVHGVTVDLLRALAEAVDRPLALQVFDNSGQVTEAVTSGACDVAFMPHDAARAQKVDFGPAYFTIESTYLVPAGSAIQSIDEVNRKGVCIVAIANTTTGRSAHRTAPLADFEEVAGVDLMVARAEKGEGDAYALTHDSLAGLMPKLPGARVLPGHFQQTGICIAVPKNKPKALRLVSEWLDRAKSSGLVRRAFDANGFKDAAIAP
jgi:polar amino acid transport system substrate-binding protein